MAQLSVKNDENEMLLAKITKDEKLLADRENTLKTVSVRFVPGRSSALPRRLARMRRD
jgi:hypothetical protein